MQYHIAKMNVPLENDLLDPTRLVSAADKNLAEVLYCRPIHRGMYSPTRLSFIETFVGLADTVLVRGPFTCEQMIRDNRGPAKAYLEYAVDLTLSDPAEGTDDECEVLYGRAGLLYALLYLRKAIRGSGETEMAALENLISDATISRLVDSIVARGKRGAHLLSLRYGGSVAVDLPPLMWSWHRKRYLGAAHGVGKDKNACFFEFLIELESVAGILQILLSCPYSLIQKHLWDITKTAEWLGDLQDEDGNWPAKFPDDDGGISDNELVQ